MSYRFTFFYLPLVVLAVFLSLFLVPSSLGNPWAIIKVWDFLLTLAWAYLIVGVLRVGSDPSVEAIHLIAMGLCILLVSAGLCFLSFSSFHYLLKPTNWPFTGFLTLCVIFVLLKGAFRAGGKDGGK